MNAKKQAGTAPVQAAALPKTNEKLFGNHTIPHTDTFAVREKDRVVFLDDAATARVGAALAGAHAILHILQQRELAKELDEEDTGLSFSPTTAANLIDGAASLLHLAEIYTGGGGPRGVVNIEHDSEEARHLRTEAHKASHHHDRRRAAMVMKYAGGAQ